MQLVLPISQNLGRAFGAYLHGAKKVAALVTMRLNLVRWHVHFFGNYLELLSPEMSQLTQMGWN